VFHSREKVSEISILNEFFCAFNGKKIIVIVWGVSMVENTRGALESLVLHAELLSSSFKFVFGSFEETEKKKQRKN
jgi:hypothetical protein